MIGLIILLVGCAMLAVALAYLLALAWNLAALAVNLVSLAWVSLTRERLRPRQTESLPRPVKYARGAYLRRAANDG
jgi:membrane protein implicated in regulation of membrane protease activity